MKMPMKNLDREATIAAGAGHELDSVLTIKGNMYPNCWRTDAAFRDDALTLAWFLRGTLPSGVLDALPDALEDLRQRQEDEINAREQEEFEAGQRPKFTPTIQLKDEYDIHNERKRIEDAKYNWVNMGYRKQDNGDGTYSFVPFREEVEIYD